MLNGFIIMENIKEFFDGLTTLEWIIIVCALYVSIFFHKAIEIIKEMRSE